MSLTPEQAQAAFAEGSVAVVAGAGTGKTHMLSTRYLHHLSQGLSPLEIVAVTFTERAADELKARVRRAAQGAAIGPDALAELEAAQIGTLHALAARICRDHPDAAGVPPDFGLLDDFERTVWLGEQFAAALGSLPSGTLGTLPYSRLEATLTQLLEEPSLASAAFAHGPETWPELVARERAGAKARLTGHPEWRAAVQTLLDHAGVPEDPIERARQGALRGLEALEREANAEAMTYFAAIDRRGGAGKRWPRGGLSEVKAALKTVQELSGAARKDGLIALELGEADDRLAALLPTLKGAFEAVQTHIAAAKRRARVLDFADLELHALRALSHAHVREHYRKRWRAFLIDEFQDTSPVQAELLERLTEHATVTLVGDEKQAIYGFRGAEAVVFRRARDRLSRAGGEAVQLSESFRTHAPLVTALNTVFAPVLGDAHQHLSARRADPPHPQPHLTLAAVTADKGVPKPARCVSEARAVGEWVKGLQEQGVLVHDSASGALRPLRWGDVAVLTRTWAPLDAFSEVFSALEVPALHSGGGDLLGTREAKDALALVRFLADPHDDLALAALLRSPFFAVDDRTLQTFAQALSESESWWDGLHAPLEGLPEPLTAAAATLGALVSDRRETLPSRLLGRADYLTGYTAVLANLPGAARRQADWNGFVELVRRLEGGLSDVFTVARRLRRLLRSGAELPRPTLGAGDAVALMTVHRAKGLEWPVVVLADLDHTPPTATPELMLGRGLGVALRLGDDEGSVAEPALYTILKGRARAREREEAKRVLYVALTRARDRVLLTATQPKGGGLELLGAGLAALGLFCDEIPHDPVSLYPDLPAPPPQTPPSADATLWSRSPAALGRYARYVDPKGGVTDAAPTADTRSNAWDEVLMLVGEMDGGWLPHLQALRDAGVSAPHPDTVFRELTAGGTVTPYPSVCSWGDGKGALALVDAATPPRTFDQRLLRLDPVEQIQDTVERVRAAMEG